AWRDLLAPLVEHERLLTALILGNRRELPPGLLTGSGLRVLAAAVGRLLEQGTPAWNLRFRGDEAPALITGVAAHSIARLPSLAAAGTALMLATNAHGAGWPVPVGGAQAITAAMIADREGHGGRVVTDGEVTSSRELARARTYIADPAPAWLL